MDVAIDEVATNIQSVIFAWISKTKLYICLNRWTISKTSGSYHIIHRKHVTHGSKGDNDRDITTHRILELILGRTEFMMNQLCFGETL